MSPARRVIAAVAVCCVGAGAAGWSMVSLPTGTARSETALVSRASFDVRVDFVGVLDAAAGENVVSPMRADRGKILFIVPDGTRVAQGDVLVRFDPAPIEAEILRLEAELRSREAVLAYMQQAVELEKTQIERAVEQAEMEARQSGQEYERYRAYIDDLDGLSRRAVPVASEIGQARRKADALQLQLRKAQSTVERVRREGVHRLGQAMAEERKAANEEATTRKNLELMARELQQSVLRAPTAGFVVLHETFQGEQKRRLRAGDSVWQGQPVLYLPDLSRFVVRTRVREEDLHKLRVGHESSLQLDAYPDALLRARVQGIGALALENASGASAGKHFQLMLSIEGVDDRLRPGMTARGTIVASRAAGVLAVPIAAVFYDRDEPVCRLIDSAAGPVMRAVKLGRRGDDLVEVLAGLSEGERVALVPP